MPVGNLQNLPDADLEAIYLYLREQKPIKNLVGRTAPAAAAGGKK